MAERRPPQKMSTVYFDAVEQPCTVKGTHGLSQKGDEFHRSTGGLYHALCSLKEGYIRQLNDQRAFALTNQYLRPVQFPMMDAMLSHGVSSVYKR